MFCSFFWSSYVIDVIVAVDHGADGTPTIKHAHPIRERSKCNAIIKMKSKNDENGRFFKDQENVVALPSFSARSFQKQDVRGGPPFSSASNGGEDHFKHEDDEDVDPTTNTNERLVIVSICLMIADCSGDDFPKFASYILSFLLDW